MQNNLKGKTVIITGGSSGFGKALSLLLNQAEMSVFVWGLHRPGNLPQGLHFIQCDVREPLQVQAAWQQTVEITGGRMDFLVNNAGLGYFGFLEDMSYEQFDEIMKVNVYGIFNTCKAVIPTMKQQGSGHVINISSTAGLEGMAQVSAYCGSKHAVRGISDSLFRELRDFGIKVTTVYPGSAATQFFRHNPNIEIHDNMMSAEEVAYQIYRAMDTSTNFLMNEMQFRPLQPKPKKK